MRINYSRRGHVRYIKRLNSCVDPQRMEPSNVSGGYWQQLPAAMQTQWRFGTKAKVELECEDVSRQHSAHKKEHGLSTWQYQVPSFIRTLSKTS